MPTLRILDDSLGIEKFDVPPGASTVGRGSECDLVLAAKSVSRVHARLEWSNGELQVEDLGSRNGTSVNGTRLGSPTRLADGDHVRFGGIEVAVDNPPVESPSEDEAETVLAGDLETRLAPPADEASAGVPPSSADAAGSPATPPESPAPRRSAPEPADGTRRTRTDIVLQAPGAPSPTALELGGIAVAAYLVVVLLGLVWRSF